MASYNGSNIFGVAVNVNHNPDPAVRQENQFFGLNGIQNLHGGERGSVFEVSGVLTGADAGAILAAEAVINSYVDGVGRTFVDNFGRTYNNVVVLGRVTPALTGIKPASGAGYAMPYTVLLKWLGGAS